MARPQPADFAPFYQNYVNLVEAADLQSAFSQYNQPIKSFFNQLPEAKGNFAYADGKWTVKEVLQHVIDTERIFAYRALCIARKDKTAFPGFDENQYALHSNANGRTLTDLQIEFSAVRHTTNLLFQSFFEEQLAEAGTASNHTITVNALGFIILGHLLHHKNILEQRYL
jgi:hypothetical protein